MVSQERPWIAFIEQFQRPPARVVSLVPSVTESLFDLKFGENVVGVTEYCVHPAEKVVALPKVGGTKNPRPDRILELKPDLVIANREENTKGAVEALEAAGVPVWVTFPKTVDDSIALLRGLARLFQSQLALQQVEMLEVALEWAEAAASDLPPTPYFCPIWQEGEGPEEIAWMTFNQDTYCHDLLARLGGRNIFADRFPAHQVVPAMVNADDQNGSKRYPRVSPAEVIAGQPDLILLPNEPYDFGAAQAATINLLLVDTPAVKNQRLRLFDGSLLTWHGTRLAQALQILPHLLAN